MRARSLARACRRAVLRADTNPPAGVRSTRTRGSAWAAAARIAGVWSTEPSSTATTSWSASVWARSDSRHAGSVAWASRTGRRTETRTGWTRCLPVADEEVPGRPQRAFRAARLHHEEGAGHARPPAGPRRAADLRLPTRVPGHRLQDLVDPIVATHGGVDAVGHSWPGREDGQPPPHERAEHFL